MSADVAELPGAREARENQHLSILGLALRTLSARVYQWTTLGLVAGAWGYTLMEPAPWRIVAAVLFTLLTHVPTWAWTREKGGRHAEAS